MYHKILPFLIKKGKIVTMDKSIRCHIKQVIKVNITSNGTYQPPDVLWHHAIGNLILLPMSLCEAVCFNCSFRRALSGAEDRWSFSSLTWFHVLILLQGLLTSYGGDGNLALNNLVLSMSPTNYLKQHVRLTKNQFQRGALEDLVLSASSFSTGCFSGSCLDYILLWGAGGELCHLSILLLHSSSFVTRKDKWHLSWPPLHVALDLCSGLARSTTGFRHIWIVKVDEPPGSQGVEGPALLGRTQLNGSSGDQPHPVFLWVCGRCAVFQLAHWLQRWPYRDKADCPQCVP